jgi:hypothetical protein
MSDRKKVLVVAVEDVFNPIYEVGLDPAKVGTLRPLIRTLKEALDHLVGKTNYLMDYIAAPIGTMPPGPVEPPPRVPPGLLYAVHQYNIYSPPEPDVIVTVASAATRTARSVFPRPIFGHGVPIVFTVVSLPDQEPEGNPLVDPKTMKGKQITGVSRSLVQTVCASVTRFTQCLPPPLAIHWVRRYDLFQAERAEEFLYACTLPAGFSLAPHVLEYEAQSWEPIRAILEDPGRLPPTAGQKNARTGLFLIPDDVVVGLAPDVINSAQHPDRKIPAFVQQIELVKPPTAGEPDRPCAFAGYGLPPETIGLHAANLVERLFREPLQASEIPVVFPENFEFWVNTAVAKELGIVLPPGLLKRPDVHIADQGKAYVPVEHYGESAPLATTARKSRRG